MTDPTRPTPPPSGPETRVLGGRYEIGDLVGRGGMADVHVGHDLRLGRTVAIKILRTDLARDSSFLARFRREAQAAAGLNHPSIVGVFDSGEETVHEAGGGAAVHVPYIVMEFVEGRTLRELINEHRVLDPDEAARITAAVLAAMEYAHDRGLVHRDIKPANVMVTEAGAVKVMDFGIARALADTAATMTQTQAVMGTARYLSPEQAQGLDVDGRSDLYSVGCLLYELLAGRTPFQGDPVSLVYQHLGEAPKAPSTHERSLPQALDAITLHALEKDRDERYQTAGEFRADLNRARADEPISSGAQASYARALGIAGAGAAAAARARRGDPGSGDEDTQVVRPAEGDDTRRWGAGAAGAAAGAGMASASASGGGAAGGPPRDGGDATDPGRWDRASSAYASDDDRYERTDEMPVRERRHRGAALLLGILALLAVAGMSWVLWQVVGPGSEEEPVLVTVVDTVGMTEPEARTTLTGLGFTVDSEERNSDAPVDEVIEQDPPSGQLEEGSEVLIVVSAGPEAIEVPDLLDMEEQAARDLLEREGFTNVRAEAEEVHDPDVEEGHVVSTEPEPGDEVEPDREIVLTVASGQVEVPDVVGLSSDEAAVALNRQNLAYTFENRRTAEADPGTVLEQSVDEGELVDQGEEIVLVVAAEPVLVETQTVERTVTSEPTPEPEPEPTDGPTDEPDPNTPAPTDTEPTTDPPTDEPGPPVEPTDPPDGAGPPFVPPGQRD
ncbi:Stk1 family PASTA domain-containing Ser/Thr kinase [Ornithinimicrobium kibberense]|uniref:non-specific serine/threonine protein kinase n=1 Tax=Ornithinimicrobium kibberense TaxID=282060 RepID=A0ABV5V1K1_9MICO|nr:Stk1 family PASTA domain-containing Ser/Thr kinase [Ornithinimicrobium kibberense]